MATLISLSEYKTWANISGTAQDTLLNFLLGAVSTDMRRWCDRNLTNGFESAERTESYDGTDEQTIQLREWPVTSIAYVRAYRADGTYETLDSSTYRVNSDSGVLSRIDAVLARYPVSAFGSVDSTFGVQPWFEQGFDNISVRYTAGYSPIPDDIKMAAMRLMDLAYAARGRNFGIQSESLGQYSYTNMDPKATAAIKADLLAAYTAMGA
jgi:hypothetical protein